MPSAVLCQQYFACPCLGRLLLELPWAPAPVAAALYAHLHALPRVHPFGVEALVSFALCLLCRPFALLDHAVMIDVLD